MTRGSVVLVPLADEDAALLKTFVLEEKGLSVTHSVTSDTDAASEILAAGKQVGADLVVMSTHGRSGLSRLVWGSVAERVLRHAEMPLLMVPA